jgi:hypothetical protein
VLACAGPSRHRPRTSLHGARDRRPRGCTPPRASCCRLLLCAPSCVTRIGERQPRALETAFQTAVRDASEARRSRTAAVEIDVHRPEAACSPEESAAFPLPPPAPATSNCAGACMQTPGACTSQAHRWTPRRGVLYTCARDDAACSPDLGASLRLAQPLACCFVAPIYRRRRAARGVELTGSSGRERLVVGQPGSLAGTTEGGRS